MNQKIKVATFALTATLGLFLSACTKQQTTQVSSDIKTQLIKYTDDSSAGPTSNYYYKNGTANMSNFGTLSNGQTSFDGDSQGRTGIAKAVLTYDEFKASIGSRQGTPLKPPFYPHNVKVAISFSMTGKTYHGYLWNKSHSIADSLLGTLSYTSQYNFTAGTRSQNVGADQNGGMRAAEEIAENYWKAHPNTSETISYMTAPIYKGNEKIPRGSIVDEKSSDGKINVELVIINSAEGYAIDYNTGTYTKK
jgi:DNA-entry nuclease